MMEAFGLTPRAHSTVEGVSAEPFIFTSVPSYTIYRDVQLTQSTGWGFFHSMSSIITWDKFLRESADPFLFRFVCVVASSIRQASLQNTPSAWPSVCSRTHLGKHSHSGNLLTMISNPKWAWCWTVSTSHAHAWRHYEKLIFNYVRIRADRN